MLEIDLPDMPGFEVLAKLVPRTYRPEIAVIVLTRLLNQVPVRPRIKERCTSRISKTMGSGHLLEQAIRKAIGTVQVLNRLVS